MSAYSADNDKQNQLNFNSFNSAQFENPSASASASTVPTGHSTPIGLTPQLRSLSSKQIQKSLSTSGLPTASSMANYNWSSTAATNPVNNPYTSSVTTAGGTSGNLDLWSNLNSTSANSMDKDTTTPSTNPRDQYFQSNKDMMYNSFFDHQNMTAAAAVNNNNNLANNDVDSLALHLLQLNAANPQQSNSRQAYHQSSNQFASSASGTNAATGANSGYGLSHNHHQQQQQSQQQAQQQHHHQQSYNKWPSYSGNAPSVPLTASYSDSQSTYIGHSTNPSLSQYSQSTYSNQQQQQAQQQQQQQQQPRQDSAPFIGTTESGNIDNMNIKIQLKQTIITKLEKEVERLTTILKSISSNGSSTDPSNFEVPKNHIDIYNKLAEKLQATEDELSDTKLRLEAVLTAISLNPNQSATKSGRYDEEEVAHKIITKLQMLSEENDELSKMLSYGKSKEKDILIGLLRKQNEELLEKITKLEVKVNESK